MSKLTVSLTDGVKVEISSLSEASKLVTADHSRKGMGSTEWSDHHAGLVRYNGKVIAHISYNGRAWLGSNVSRGMTEIGEAEFLKLIGMLVNLSHNPKTCKEAARYFKHWSLNTTNRPLQFYYVGIAEVLATFGDAPVPQATSFNDSEGEADDAAALREIRDYEIVPARD